MAEKADAELGALAVDVVAELQLDGLLAIDGEVNFVGDADDVNADGGFAGSDDRANRQQVGAIGVTSRALTLGITMGPLAARL